MNKLLTNIKQLVQVEDSGFNSNNPSFRAIDDAWLHIKDGSIFDMGDMQNIPKHDAGWEQINCRGKFVLPSFVDAHTHLVHAASREQEYVERIKGTSYEEIAKQGGGILNSARKLQQMNEDKLYELSAERLHKVIRAGTGALEVKSGYGLTIEAELKMLRVIKRLKQSFPVEIKSSFLGAHALPLGFKENRADYIKLVTEKMLPAVAAEGLADYIDVFCESVAFSAAETDQILTAACKHGLIPKIHTNQFNSMGGIETAIKHEAVSVDHLEVINDQEIAELARSSTAALLLPFAPFFLNDPYPPARKLIDAGVQVAIASDYNPGSAPAYNMMLCMALACIKVRMLPEEALSAATYQGAKILGLERQLGSIAKGKDANLIITKQIPSVNFLSYSFGENLIDQVLIKGEEYK